MYLRINSSTYCFNHLLESDQYMVTDILLPFLNLHHNIKGATLEYKWLSNVYFRLPNITNKARNEKLH